MAPPSMASVYHQYKEDTNAVAAWLASTAKSRGYYSNLASAQTTTAAATTTASNPTSKRLKGKARKEEKAAAQQAQASSSKPSGPVYIIAIDDFVPLAKFLAACKKPIVLVPLSFTNTLNRVITTRSGFGKRLAKLRETPDASSDSNHAYFVGVLEEVREVLKLCVPPATPAAPVPSPAAADPVGEVGGRFAGLSVQDPSEAFLNAPDIERPTPAKDDKATYKAEPQKDLAEIMFAYDLLLNDLNAIRSRITWIWTKFKAGDFDLISAAIATNTACDLARQLIEDMAPMFEAHGGVIEIAKQFYYHKCLELGFSGTCPSQDSPDLIFDTYDFADLTYMIPIVILEKFLQMCQPADIAVTGPCRFDTHDQSANWSSIPNSEKFSLDKMVMWEMLCEITIMVNYVPRLIAHDEFIRGVQELGRTREISMSLVFAAQVFLDIHHNLRDKVFTSHQGRMAEIDRMDEDLKLHIDFFEEGRTKNFSFTDDTALRQLREDIRFVRADPIHILKVETTTQHGVPCPPSNLTILKYSPVNSGLWLFHIRERMYRSGLYLGHMTSSLLYPMHLYNALRQEKLLSTKEVPTGVWIDMEQARWCVGNESFFVGEPPKQPTEYMKNLLLMTGMTAAACNNTRNPSAALTSNRLTSKKGPRNIKDFAPVSGMFVDRYVMKNDQVDWTAEDVENIISRRLIQREDRVRINKQVLSSKARATSHKIMPEKLIESLVIALHEESSTMAFPYLTLQRSAWGMLRKVRDSCEELVLQLDGPEYIKDERRLPGIVLLILWELKQGDDRLFVKAGEALKEELRKGEGRNALRRQHGFG